MDTETAQGSVKPRVSLEDYKWLMAFERFANVKAGTLIEAKGLEFKFSHTLSSPHPPSVWLTYRKDKKQHQHICRMGDQIIFELVKNLPSANTTEVQRRK